MSNYLEHYKNKKRLMHLVPGSLYCHVNFSILAAEDELFGSRDPVRDPVIGIPHGTGRVFSNDHGIVPTLVERGSQGGEVGGGSNSTAPASIFLEKTFEQHSASNQQLSRFLVLI